MKNTPIPEMVGRDHAQLRHRMRESLARHSTAPATMEAIERRIMAQWSTWVAADAGYTFGPSGIVRLVARSRGIQLSFVALALVLVLAYHGLRHGSEPSIEDLLEPDVLSLVALGEL